MENTDNPFFDGNLGTLPFDRVRVEHFKPAFVEGIRLGLEEHEKIVNDPSPPTFDNTIGALENSYRFLSRVQTVFSVWSGCLASDELSAVEEEITPLLVEFSSKLGQCKKMYDRIKQIPTENLTEEQRRLLKDTLKAFVKSGVSFPKRDQTKLTNMSTKLGLLNAEFQRHLLAEEDKVTEVYDTAGLGPDLLAAMERTATEHGLPASTYAVLNTSSMADRFLEQSPNRALREKVWRLRANRCDNGDENDNKTIINGILKIRRELATMRGYETHAHYKIDDTMAGTPQKALDLLDLMWQRAVDNVKSESKELRKLSIKDGVRKLMPWDYEYYSEKLRKEKYDFDQATFMPYLQLDKLQEGAFWLAGELFGYKFIRAQDELSVWHPDVQVWRVEDKQGQLVGRLLYDPYVRKGKNPGAWMSSLISQENMSGENVRPVVEIVTNFIKSVEGPTLVSMRDAETLFHEFGHALHGLSSRVTYPSTSGTSVVRDYVEFPSQLMEYWLEVPWFLKKFALHVETQEPISDELLDRFNASKKFNSGYNCVKYMASAYIDLRLHLRMDKKNLNLRKFEKDLLNDLGMPHEASPYHRFPNFLHIFGHGYDALYYSYRWAECLSADGFEAFENKIDPEVAKRYMDNVLSVGDSIDPAEGYRRFRGRDPSPQALMDRLGI